MKRICTKCGIEKDLEEFVKDKKCLQGRRRMCKKCRVGHQKKWRTENKERILAQEKKYRAENKEKISAQQKKYRAENKEKESSRKKKWQVENKEKVSAIQKKYQVENKERISAQQKKHREGLPDVYIKRLIVKGIPLKPKDIPQCLVDLKREELKINRLIREMKV